MEDNKERVIFYEEGHKYVGEDSGARYESVSGLNKRILAPYVDWDGILVRKADKLGITPEELQKRWDKARDEGTRAGTAVHSLFEEEFYKGEYFSWWFEDYKVIRCETDGDKKFQRFGLESGHVYPECILSLVKDHVKLAGQADAIFVDEDNFIHILDYKTDKEITYKGFTPWRGKEQGMKPPFQKIGDCNYNHYTHKMSTYMFMALQSNPHLKPGTITLEHVPIERDKDGLPVWGDNGRPIIKSRANIDVVYNEELVRGVLNEYYKVTR